MTEELIERTSLRVPGWSLAKVYDWLVAADTSSCWSFSAPRNEEGVNGQNAEIDKLIVALGDNDSKNRAIFRPVAERQGIVSDQELDDLAD